MAECVRFTNTGHTSQSRASWFLFLTKLNADLTKTWDGHLQLRGNPRQFLPLRHKYGPKGNTFSYHKGAIVLSIAAALASNAQSEVGPRGGAKDRQHTYF